MKHDDKIEAALEESKRIVEEFKIKFKDLEDFFSAMDHLHEKWGIQK